MQGPAAGDSAAPELGWERGWAARKDRWGNRAVLIFKRQNNSEKMTEWYWESPWDKAGTGQKTIFLYQFAHTAPEIWPDSGHLSLEIPGDRVLVSAVLLQNPAFTWQTQPFPKKRVCQLILLTCCY